MHIWFMACAPACFPDVRAWPRRSCLDALPRPLLRRRALAVASGPPRSATTRSNRVPLAIGASIAATATLAAPSRLRIDLAPGVNAQTVEAEVSIAGEVYQRTAAGPVLAGEFRAVSPTRFEVMLTFDPADGQTRPVRLGIAGIDCAPFWIAP